jgi:hypothetical protein
VAAAGIGKDTIPAANPWQVFGPMTVAMVAAENAMICDQPDSVLKIGRSGARAHCCQGRPNCWSSSSRS